MKTWSKFLDNLRSGIYYFSVKYESVERAKSSVNLRMRAIFFLYYFSLVLLLLGGLVKIFGTHKVSALYYTIIFFGSYLILYNFLIDNSSKELELNVDDSIEAVKRKISIYKYVFIGGFIFMELAAFIIA